MIQRKCTVTIECSSDAGLLLMDILALLNAASNEGHSLRIVTDPKSYTLSAPEQELEEYVEYSQEFCFDGDGSKDEIYKVELKQIIE
jgi:hypothetical protein